MNAAPPARDLTAARFASLLCAECGQSECPDHVEPTPPPRVCAVRVCERAADGVKTPAGVIWCSTHALDLLQAFRQAWERAKLREVTP